MQRGQRGGLGVERVAERAARRPLAVELVLEGGSRDPLGAQVGRRGRGLAARGLGLGARRRSRGALSLQVGAEVREPAAGVVELRARLGKLGRGGPSLVRRRGTFVRECGLGRPDPLVRGGPRRGELGLGGRSSLGDLRLGGAPRLGDLRLGSRPRGGDLRLRGAPRLGHRRLRVRPGLGQLGAEILELGLRRRELGLVLGQLRARPVELGGALLEPVGEVAAGVVEVRRRGDRLLAGVGRLGLELLRARSRGGELGLVLCPLGAQRGRAGLAHLEHAQPHGVARARHLRRPHPELQIACPAPGRRRGGQGVGQRGALVLVARRPPLQLRRPRGQRVALGDQRLHLRLELRAAQLERVQRPQRLRGHARLRLLGRLGAPGAALRHHGAVDDLAAGLLGLLVRHGREQCGRRALVEARGDRQRRPLAALPLEPHATARDRLRQQVRAPPHAPVPARARRVGQRLVARHPAADRRAQHRQPLGRRSPGRPAPAHAHEAGVSAGGQPLDRLEREAVEDRRRGGFRHRRDGPRRSGGFPPERSTPWKPRYFDTRLLSGGPR